VRSCCELPYLPLSTAPAELNPIKEAFWKVKELLRRAEARTRQSLIEVGGWALDALPARDARVFFGHCGYPSMGYLL
jgi:hypothetical protein